MERYLSNRHGEHRAYQIDTNENLVDMRTCRSIDQSAHFKYSLG